MRNSLNSKMVSARLTASGERNTAPYRSDVVPAELRKRSRLRRACCDSSALPAISRNRGESTASRCIIWL